MKKITALTIAALIGASSLFAAVNDASHPATPELLKQKELYTQPELFESPVIFSNPQANAEVIADYEANKSNYTDKALLPVAACYLTNGNFPKALEVIDVYLKAVPDSLKAKKAKATAEVFLGRTDDGIALYKEVYAKGEKDALKPLCAVLIVGNKTAELGNYIEEIKKLSKTDMDFTSFALIYAIGDIKNSNDALIKEVLEGLDPRTALANSNQSSLDTILRIYSIKKNLFPKALLVLPAKAAANAYLWIPAREAYKEALAANPSDTLAIRGEALVEYRTGDVGKAAQMLVQAYKLGDKDAVSDATELFVLTGSDTVWNLFAKDFASYAIKPAIRVAMIQVGIRKESADVYFTGALGAGSELLYKDEGVRNLLKSTLDKFSKDPRALEVKKLLDAAK